MAATFMAVQCFKCSTMQVKQVKKSSNKWTCVVCNEKQSVRKVYAQSLMAKEVRQFVQSFNMSRRIYECPPNPDHHQTDIPIPSNSKRKTMTDWTAYLDFGDSADIHPGPKELSVKMFKKPSFSNRITSAEEELSKNDVDGCRRGKGLATAGCTEDSKWTAYLMREKEQEIDDCFNTHKRNCIAAGDANNTSDAFNMPVYHDQQFEEDIHPDFR